MVIQENNNLRKTKVSTKVFCDTCNKNFSKKYFDKHMQKFHTKLQLESKENQSANLLKTEQNLKKSIYRCRMCIFESSNEILLQNHITEENHQGNIGRKQKVSCPYCDYKGSSLHEIKFHVDAKHQDHGEKNYFCDKCNRGFIFESSYKKHNYLRHKKQVNRWCEICDLHVTSLKTHIVENHEVNGQIVCHHCDQGYL